MLKYNEPLSRHTSFHIGGQAYCWIEPDNKEDLLKAIDFAESKRKDFAIIGKGTNLLAGNGLIDKVIISLAKGFDKIVAAAPCAAYTGAGLNLAKLVKYASDKGLSGCEFLTGIPGSVGGAVFMNAGVRDIENPAEFIEIKDVLIDIEALDLKDRKIKTFAKKDIDFKYRYSGLSDKIILGARFGLEKNAKEDIKNRIKAFGKKREWLAKIDFPNAGSVFKNPSPDKSAGMLIESCGLKGKRIGGAEISKAHANIIVNVGKATASDVLSLIDLAKVSVKQKFGIELELELKII